VKLRSRPRFTTEVGPEVAPEWPPRWRVGFGTRTGAILGEATQWSALQVNLRLSDACDASLSCPGESLPVGLVAELVTDMWCWLGDKLMFRGRVTGIDDSISDDGHGVAIRATDYRGLLDRRILIAGDRVKFTQWPQAEIAWFLIDQAQQNTSGNMGITRGIAPTGRLRDREFEPGQSVGELLDNLSDVIDGFDYDVDPNLRFNVYYPHRGRETGLALDLGGTVSAIDRKTSSADFANYVWQSGAAKVTAPDAAYTPELAAGTALEGRWDVAVSDPDLKLQATVNARSERILADRQRRPDQYSVSVVAGQWEALSLAPGDWATLVVESARLNLRERVRVLEVAFDAGPDGESQAQLAAVRDPK
jgi:hypothetical protein